MHAGKLPHFEKMPVRQCAALGLVCGSGDGDHGERLFTETVERTVQWLLGGSCATPGGRLDIRAWTPTRRGNEGPLLRLAAAIPRASRRSPLPKGNTPLFAPIRASMGPANFRKAMAPVAYQLERLDAIGRSRSQLAPVRGVYRAALLIAAQIKLLQAARSAVRPGLDDKISGKAKGTRWRLAGLATAAALSGPRGITPTPPTPHCATCAACTGRTGGCWLTSAARCGAAAPPISRRLCVLA